MYKLPLVPDSLGDRGLGCMYKLGPRLSGEPRAWMYVLINYPWSQTLWGIEGLDVRTYKLPLVPDSLGDRGLG